MNITNILPAKPEIDSLNLNRLSDVMRSIWGDLLDTESMADTPSRVLKHWQTITSGLNQDPKLPLQKTFPCDHDEIVLIKDIAFNSLCEHHLLPFFGVAHVAYIPHGRVVGLSKIPRSLDILAARPQLQERLTTELALAIESALNPVVVLKHFTQTVTSCMLGAFSDMSARSEILSLVK